MKEKEPASLKSQLIVGCLSVVLCTLYSFCGGLLGVPENLRDGLLLITVGVYMAYLFIVNRKNKIP